jgi:dephospho-CoA kinase
MRAIAITGSYGSGKSTVGNILRNLNYKVVDADELARDVVVKGSEGLKLVIEKFGQEVLLPNGELDRARLAKIVFNDPTKRKSLEKILHPLIRRRWLEIYNTSKGDLIFYLIPLLFESENEYPEISKTITVYSSLENIMRRSKLDPLEVQKRLDAQLPIEEKIKRADFSIENNGTIQDLENKVKDLLACL